MIANPIMHSKTKHLELDLHFTRDVVQQKLLLTHILAGLHLADILTRPLYGESFLDSGIN